METSATKEKFIELRAQGLSFDKIAGELHKSKQTLIDWSKELEEEIANLKAVELEALYEKYFLLKQNRLQTFGEILKRLRAELETRELANVPTDKLLDLVGKYGTLLKDEFVEPRFQTSGEITEAKQERRTLEALTENRPRLEILKVG
jgi:hypothetical protein